MSQSSSYIHGAATVRSHSTRTASADCPHLLPHLTDKLRILDVGCGPGTISCDLAALVPQGQVVGVDVSAHVVSAAREVAKERGLKNVEFAEGDVYGLPFGDNEFDVVHAHQVLQHVGDPVRGLREMRRVLKPDGLLSLREAILKASVWYPESEGLQLFHDVYLRTAQAGGGSPDAGRGLAALARQTGFERSKMEVSTGTWCKADKDDREFWAKYWIDRLQQSEFRTKATELGGATVEDLEICCKGWNDYAENEDASYTILHGQLICRK
ncbi:uncharacterized protein K452DRAFT_225320 [Aplosporella prunicola CBS 121167]|uniref:Methyltransferase domain-containing protein n=1 Tax=Aplosporella prunicola CBS 121167 TaxID=1176127 RepID=A0A6A6BIS7_9PEZI|nr:uncharacterized protein K452DRAFT_225320 [Aplosporella prunicola CBS 121167]KAF2143184.1 hypothetical protein K452DRAFT_225320 [Aplosporella prunicola CBS 121167]